MWFNNYNWKHTNSTSPYNNRRSFSEDLPENVSQLGLTTAIQRLYYFKAHYLLAYAVLTFNKTSGFYSIVYETIKSLKN
jgi:hypothetical protein